MKCPNEKCNHEFEIEDFGEPFKELVVVCPMCNNKVEAFWDYQPTSEGDEYPIITELMLIKD